MRVLCPSHEDSILIRADANSTKLSLILVEPDCFQKRQGPKIIPSPLQEYLGIVAENIIVLNLVVMTHMKGDHIGGLLRAIHAEPFQQVRQ